MPFCNETTPRPRAHSAARCRPRPFSATALAAILVLAALPASGAGGSVEASEEQEPAKPEPTKQETKAAKKEAEREKKAAKEQAKADKTEAEEAASGKGEKKGKKEKQKIDLSARTADAWYAEALQRYEAGKYLDARQILLPLEDSPRSADIQEKVKLLLADTYFYQRGELNYAEALARYRSFMTFFPGSTHASYAQYQIGNCYFRQLGPADLDQSYTDNAIAEYERYIQLFPGAPQVEEARRNILEAKGLKARHDFRVAKFYWEWNNYDAAAARLADLLRTHPESPDREEALYLAASSLYRVGRRAEGDAFAARLKEDYPASKLTGGLSPGDTGDAVKRVAARETKRAKESARTRKHLLKREARNTRNVRKDSGLPTRLVLAPTDDGSPAAPASTAASVSATESAVAAQPPPPPPSRAADADKKDKRATKEAARMEKAEAEEQQAQAKQQERDAREAERQAQQEKAAIENPEKAAKKAEKERLEAEEKAEKERKEQERKEAEEQAQEAGKQERREQEDAAKAEKDAAKAEKKAEKKAKKKG